MLAIFFWGVSKVVEEAEDIGEMAVVVVIPCDPSIPISEIEDCADIPSELESNPEERINVVSTLLVRDGPMLYAHHHPSMCTSPNIRATRLAMVCGHFELRLKGDVLFSLQRGSLRLSQVQAATETIDLRFADCKVTDWLANARRSRFFDIPVLDQLAKVMNEEGSGTMVDEDAETSSDCSSKDAELLATTVPLCLVCRRPTNRLCPECSGIYLCSESCRSSGAYTARRSQLSTVGLGEWSRQLCSRPFQLSELPYEQFLLTELGDQLRQNSWWTTEIKGWSGGQSESARTVNVDARKTYAEGFAPLRGIPVESPLSAHNELALNEVGLIRITSWEEYYNLRDIPMDSPAALLLTFPLTLYYAIVEFGSVPCTVAKMLHRRLRVHIVGAEKELNFLDLFKEVSFLLPPDFSIELVFVVREDMLPPRVRLSNQFNIVLTDTLSVVLASGTYGDSLDPLFDCGSGPPDMVIGFNAGLYAYRSWHSVVEFLDHNKAVVGVFTDYNEYSGSQCASLGGAKSLDTIQVNPFRQPRAMPGEQR